MKATNPPITCSAWKPVVMKKTEPYVDDEIEVPCSVTRTRYSLNWPSTKVRPMTNVIVNQHRHVFTTFSFAFPIPGQTGAANLGLPDLLFFALFLAAAARFSLRPGWTWVLMTLSFGATLAIAAVWRGGLPALPLLALSFLLANADLIWTRLRAMERGTRFAGGGRRSSG